MPYLLGFHAKHFWNPWSILINPRYVLFLVPKILLKTALAYCEWCAIEFFCLLRRLRSFQRGTVGLCRSTGIKITSCQCWRFEKNSATRPTSNHTSAARVRFTDDRIMLQLWQLVTLQPVDLQRPTVPLWKDLDLLNIHTINLKTTLQMWNCNYSGFFCESVSAVL